MIIIITALQVAFIVPCVLQIVVRKNIPNFEGDDVAQF